MRYHEIVKHLHSTHRHTPEHGARPSLPALQVTVIEGPDRGLSRTLLAPRILLGRGETADVRLTDPTVSQCHAELVPGERGVLIQDLGSTNGVAIDDLLVERAWIRKGGVLRLGATLLRVEPTAGAPRESVPAFGDLVGAAPAMCELYALLQRLRHTELSLLIQGETGTGKERVARAIHAASRRAEQPFVVLDCTAIPPALAASRLFGHEKGSFTGASERAVGVFEAAHGGVLFLDEVGELPLELQPLLLRVLQQREVVPVGSNRPRPVDVRVLCATWRDLREMVNRGAFREDLYYRLAQATVWVPPLRERQEDLGVLCRHFLSGQPAHVPAARSISAEALEALRLRPFPGNVRELQNTVERLACLAQGPEIGLSDLELDRALERRAGGGALAAGRGADPDVPLSRFKVAKQLAVDEFERGYLTQLMRRAGPNLSRAAGLAGLERHNLRDLLRKHGLYTVKE